MVMLAYHSSQVEKDAILAQLIAHRDADELVKGIYWEEGKGCAVGCTVHSSNHSAYETKFGIPQMLARLEDCIFEGLPNGEAKEWPIEFVAAIRPGADLSKVGWEFLARILSDPGINPGIEHPLVADAVKQCLAVVRTMADTGKVDRSAASAAASAARSAELSAEIAETSTELSADSEAIAKMMSAARAARSAASAASAARSAEWSMEMELSADSAMSAVRSAASAARSVVMSAGSAANAAVSAALSAEWRAAESAARSAEKAAESAELSAAASAWGKMSKVLIELLQAAP